ncbi:SDR family oxidoreductase [Sporichthya sp.]|uniref:SDR family oxidoreductase n=1 Tax=Sporichthya sp. TaxID=65475 RepID=UPI0017AA46C3|nr:SDR family oxidoreductase [Sporichthya sp.]MBA3743502.1 SDR family oxidoreductase [Sporichthya sp.]
MSAPEQRVALVANGGSGVGVAIVRGLHEAGMTVAVGRRPDRPNDNDVPPEAASVHEGSLGNAADCERAVNEVLAKHGRLDSVVCVAMRRGFTIETPIERLEPAEWDRVINAYLSGPYYLMRAALGPMLEQGYGRIVTVVSTDGGPGSEGQAANGVATGGLITLTQRIAREVAGRGVTANVVMTGLVASPWVHDELPEEFLEQLAQVVPAGRLADTAEVSRAIGFLCAPDAGYVTGQVLGVDGGLRT